MRLQIEPPTLSEPIPPPPNGVGTPFPESHDVSPFEYPFPDPVSDSPEGLGLDAENNPPMSIAAASLVQQQLQLQQLQLQQQQQLQLQQQQLQQQQQQQQQQLQQQQQQLQQQQQQLQQRSISRRSFTFKGLKVNGPVPPSLQALTQDRRVMGMRKSSEESAATGASLTSDGIAESSSDSSSIRALEPAHQHSVERPSQL